MPTLPRPLRRSLIAIALRLHNLSYRWVGRLSGGLEPDGLHPKHRLMNYHHFFLEQISSRDHVLDIGCGNGALTLDLAAKCAGVIGIDISSRNIAECKRRSAAAGRHNVEFRVGDAAKMSFESTADYAVLSDVLEHIEDRVGMLRQLSTAASCLLIRVPLIERDWITLYKRELGIDYRLDPTHCVEYTQESFDEELREAGLETQSRQIRFGEIWAVCKFRRPPHLFKN